MQPCCIRCDVWGNNVKVTPELVHIHWNRDGVLYKLSDISDAEKIMSDSCPGWIDGSNPDNWAKRYGTAHSFSCMEPDFKFVPNSNYALLTLPQV